MMTSAEEEKRSGEIREGTADRKTGDRETEEWKMGKAVELRDVKIADLKPYERNAKQHTKEQIERIGRSIQELGFLSPCLIDGEMNVIAGHGRIMAAKQIGMETVPCVFIEGLSEKQRRAYILADNRLTEMGGWNSELIRIELDDLKMDGFDISLTGFGEIDVGGAADWFSREEKDGNKRQEGNDEYNAFLDKFEEPKTTDDCYTPENVYNAVADWVAKEYGVSRETFVRPFYPGGNYQAEKYPEGCVVVDNPPFSILAEIIRWYCERGIRFFLFAPTLSLFTAVGADVEYMPIGVKITYENKANINTSFINNLGENRIHVAGDLYEAVDKVNKENEKAMTADLPEYEYPVEAVLAGKIYRLAKYGQTLKIPKSECVYRNRLDAQKKHGKDAFGGLFLISERAAAERAAAERENFYCWELSEQEKEIIQKLSGASGAEV